VEFASRYTDSCRSSHSNDLSTVVKDKEGHTVDDYSATERKMSEECGNKMNVADQHFTHIITALCYYLNCRGQTLL
jgi:hypothetical protein